MRGEVAGWLADLSADDYEVRERARAALLLHGGRARDLLEARRDDPDPEVRRTVRAVLDRLSPESPEERPPGPEVDLAAIGTVTLDTSGPLVEMLRLLGNGHDAAFVVPAGFDRKESEAHVTREPFFRVLDLLAGVAGLDASPPFDPSGTLTLRESPEPDGQPVPTAYAGPFRVRVARVTTVLTLGAVPGRTHALALGLQWSPDVQVVSLQSPLLKLAQDERGRAFRVPSSGGNVTYGIGGTSTSMEVALSLQPAGPEAGERIARLEVGIPLKVRHGRKWVTLKNVDDLPRRIDLPAEMTGGGRGGSVTLRRFEPPEHPGGTYVVEVAAQLDAEVARESARAYLEGADGTLASLGLSARSTTSDGTVEMVGRGRFQGSQGPVGVRVSWFVREGQGEAPFVLEGIPLR